jgi:5-oxoprolinase (ATP-hydrolysing) subunit B
VSEAGPPVEATDAPRIEALGDAALLVTFGERIDLELNRRATALAAEIERLATADERFGPPVPAYASVLVPFDPVDIGVEGARELVVGALAAIPEETAPAVTGALVEIPVRYGGDDGPDLDDVAAFHGVSSRDVAELHASIEYRVFFLGFAPGFGYLGPLPAGLETPRRASPRERVPAGSVGIAGAQTGVYPMAMPGGWQVIGRTEAPMWDLAREEPALIAPGDRVRFVPIR